MSYYGSNYYGSNFYVSNYFQPSGGAPVSPTFGVYKGLYLGLYVNIYKIGKI